MCEISKLQLFDISSQDIFLILALTDHIMLEAATRGVLLKKFLLKISQYLLEKTAVLESLFNKVAGLRAAGVLL